MAKNKDKDPNDDLARTEALLREMEDDIRREQMASLWKRYGGALIGICVLIVLATAGHVAWSDWKSKRNMEHTDKIYEWLAEEDAVKRLENTKEAVSDPQTVQEWLVLFYAANDALQENDFEIANAFYERLRKNREKGGELRWLADIMELRIEMNTATDGFDALRKKFEDLGAQTANPWRALALFDAAIIAGERQQDYSAALTLLESSAAASYGSTPLMSMIGDMRHLYTIKAQNAGQAVPADPAMKALEGAASEALDKASEESADTEGADNADAPMNGTANDPANNEEQ